MKKRNLLKIFAMVLCLVTTMFMIVACDKPVVPPVPTPEEPTVEEMKADLAKAIANSLNLSFKNGFNLDLTGTATSNTADATKSVTFKVQGNVLAPDATVGDVTTAGNNNFAVEIARGTDVIFGIYNKGENLYVTVGTGIDKVEYNFGKASIFQALRMFLVQNVSGFVDLPDLGNIEIGTALGLGEMSLKDALALVLPSFISDDITFSDGVYDANIDVNFVINTVMEMIGGDLGGIDLGAIIPETCIINLSVKPIDEKLKDVGLKLTLKDSKTDVVAGLNLVSGNVGIFGAVKADFAPVISASLLAAEERSIIENRVAGTINMMGVDKDGKPVVIKTADWQLVAKLDLFNLVEKNFVLSDEAFADNYFHFQVSHKCNKTCATYCEKTLASVQSPFFPGRYKHTSIIDIAFAPNQLGTSNIVADISVFDLMSADALDKLVSALANMSLTSSAQFVQMLLSGSVVLNINTDAIMLKEDYVDLAGSETVAKPVVASAPAAAAASFDIMGLLGSLTDIISLDNGLNINIDGLKNMLGGLLPGDLLPGLSITNLVDWMTDSANVKSFNISGPEGYGSYVLTEGSNEFVKSYDVYNYAIKYNANGQDKMLIPDGAKNNIYGGYPITGAEIVGNPALSVNHVYKTDAGVLILYDKSGNIVYDGTKTISAYDFKYKYNMGKNLMVKYNFVGFGGKTDDAFAPVMGFKGLDLNKTDLQNVTVITGLMSGLNFQETLTKNLESLLAMFGGAGLELPNIDGLVAGGSVEGTITFAPSKVSDLEIKDNLKTEGEYNVNEWFDAGATITYTLDGKKVTTKITGSSDIKYDMYGYQVPGTYTMTYTNPIPELNFGEGKQTITKEFKVKAVEVSWKSPVEAGKSYVQYNANSVNYLSKMNFGTVVYKYTDGTTANYEHKLTLAQANPYIAPAFRTKDSFGKDMLVQRVGYTSVKLSVWGTEYSYDIAIKKPQTATSGTRVIFNIDGSIKLIIKAAPFAKEYKISALDASGNVLKTINHVVAFASPTIDIDFATSEVVAGTVKFAITVLASDDTIFTDSEVETTASKPAAPVVLGVNRVDNYNVDILFACASENEFKNMANGIDVRVGSVKITIEKTNMSYDETAKIAKAKISTSKLGVSKNVISEFTITINNTIVSESSVYKIEGTPKVVSATRSATGVDFVVSGVAKYSQANFALLTGITVKVPVTTPAVGTTPASTVYKDVTIAKSALTFNAENGNISFTVVNADLGDIATLSANVQIQFNNGADVIDSVFSNTFKVAAPVVA